MTKSLKNEKLVMFCEKFVSFLAKSISCQVMTIFLRLKFLVTVNL